MDAPAAALGFAVDDQSGNGIELVPVVESRRPDRRLIAKAGADGVPQIVERDRVGVGPHVAGIEEHDGAELSADDKAPFGGRREHAVASDWQARRAERAHLVYAPTANAGCAAEKILLRERNVRRVATARPDVPELQSRRENEA